MWQRLLPSDIHGIYFMKPSDNSSQTGETRRSFISKTAKIAAAVSATGFLKTPIYGADTAPSANVIGANNKIVVGFIGTGSQGMAHVKSNKDKADENNMAFGAVCDLYQKHLDNAKKATGVKDSDGYADHRKLLERKDIDAVICAPVDVWHAQVTIDALEAGKHVYCEKPMTRYVAEGWQVYDAVKRTGKIYSCGSQYTADPVFSKAAEWIKAGKLGPLVWAQGSYCRNSKSEWTHKIDAEANPQNLDWERWQGKAKKIAWDAEDEFGGKSGPSRYFSWHKYFSYNSGILGNLLSHRFYPLMLATGNPEFPSRVCCTGTKKVSTDREIPDTTHILAEFPSGLTFVIAGSTVNQVGLPDMIRGQKGTLYLATNENKMELKPEALFSEEVDAEDYKDPQSYGKIEHLEKDFYNCIRTGKTPFCNVDLSVKANTVLCLAEMSERLGITVFFDGKTRKITTSDGKEVAPLSYDSVVSKFG